MADAPAWPRRAHRRLRHSLQARLVALFLVLAMGITAVFVVGMQNALGTGWRDAVRPLLSDYVDRLVAEVGTPPSVARAEALVKRLPVTVQIDGPTIRWSSHPELEATDHRRWHNGWAHREGALLSRSTADGHRVTLGVSMRPWQERPRRIGWLTLATVLVFTAAAYFVVRRMLRPLDDIRAGAKRFGAGAFDTAIPVRRRDELGDLAGEINAMAGSLHQMLEGKRTLLLALSHELRSPVTRARLNTELLPEEGEPGARRQALLRDLQEMADLISDLLEGERLGQGHAALHREPTDLAALVAEVAQGRPVDLQLARGLPLIAVDRMRVRLLVRNLLDNAVRHGDGGRTPVVALAGEPGGAQVLTVRDFGPGVEPEVLPLLTEPFYRADTARLRSTGGVGLGLHLCRLVAQAHGGGMVLANAGPGLQAQVTLPGLSLA